jgi:predicted nucleic acid-binding Zn ribbon protein
MPDPLEIGSIIKRERARIWRDSPGLGLQSLWESVAGAEIGANTKVWALKDGVMTIGCKNGGWACELTLAADELATRLNNAGPPEKVRQLRFVHQAQAGWKSRK